MFYPWLWRKLPGPKPMKIVLAGFLIALVLSILWFVIFPNVQPFFSDEPTFNE